MNKSTAIWMSGLIITLAIIITPIVLFASREPEVSTDPWDSVPQETAHVDHTKLITGTFTTGSEVTMACLKCHEDAGNEVTQTVHWTWESEPVQLPGRPDLVTIGKKNQLNNFCIGIQGNWSGCSRCHAGYGWEDENFDFNDETNVDCLVCHADVNTYAKATAGQPAEGVDLLAAAQSVGSPTRQQCGSCHFNGGGGNAVKHGDLDETLYFPSEEIDVHMGRFDFQCISCHQTEDHQISGHMISVSPIDNDSLACTNCHDTDLHQDERITVHLDAVACQTCHIPAGAVRTATKMEWDWSTAGQDLPEDPHVYLKIKGSFVYEDNIMPTYTWFNGNADRYLIGDKIDPTVSTVLNEPLGSVNDPQAQIWPFKVHNAQQPYDLNFNYLLVPMTVGSEGFWTTFDWITAFYNNEENSGLAFSGEFDFAPTEMYWPLTHMVQPKEDALQCNDCHGDNGRMDWEALGYYGDPLRWGGRVQQLGLSD